MTHSLLFIAVNGIQEDASRIGMVIAYEMKSSWMLNKKMFYSFFLAQHYLSLSKFVYLSRVSLPPSFKPCPNKFQERLNVTCIKILRDEIIVESRYVESKYV